MQWLKARLALIGSELFAALGGGEPDRGSGLILAFVSLAVCIILLVSTAWLGEKDNTRPEKVVVLSVVLRLIYWLIIFHLSAWFVRRWMPRTLINVLDYFYLGTAVIGLAVSALRQEVDHSQYVAQWFPTALPWLVAALALRLTKTSIEVFGWYRRPAPT